MRLRLHSVAQFGVNMSMREGGRWMREPETYAADVRERADNEYKLLAVVYLGRARVLGLLARWEDAQRKEKRGHE